MAAYRGVNQQQIAQTAQDALDFLKNIDLGPEHSRSLEEWLRDQPLARVRSMVATFQRLGMADNFPPLVARGPIAAIRAAQSDDELRETMKETQFGYLFKVYEPLLAFLALSDKLQHNDDKALEIYRGLKSWDAFTSNSFFTNTDFEHEINVYLQQQYSDRWDRSFDEEDSEAAAAFQTGTNTLFDEKIKKATMSTLKEETSERVDEAALKRTERAVMAEADVLPAILSLLADSPEQLAHLRSSRGDILAYTLRGLQNAVLLEKHGHLLELPSSPIQRYRVEANSQRAWEDLTGGLRDFIEPFFDRDEIMVSDLGMEYQGGKHVLSFSAARSVAQTLANARPDLQVFDSRNTQIKPQAPGNGFSGPAP